MEVNFHYVFRDIVGITSNMHIEVKMNKFADKVILVTGATGLIGSNLVERLLAEGAKVIVMGRNAGKIEKVFHEHLFKGNLSYVAADIAQGVPKEIGVVDYIFHAASPISGTEIKTRPVDVIKANLNGTEKCLVFLKQQKEQKRVSGRLIVFSSATVYGGNPPHDKSFLEEETYMADILSSGNAAYSESKRMVEVLARAYLIQHGIESVVVRIGYVYGHTKCKPDTAFYQFIDRALAGEDIVVNSVGMGRRDNIYVDDVVDGLVLVALKGIAGEAYNLSSNGEKDNFKAIDEIALMIAAAVNELAKDKITQACIKESAGERNPGVMLDNQKIKKIGWSVETDMQEGIRKTIERYMEKR